MAKQKKKSEARQMPTTYEGWLAWEHDQWVTHHSDDFPPSNPTYDYTVGEEVVLGGLKDARVEEILDGGMRLHISYRDKGEANGKPYDNGRKPHLDWWYRISPRKLIDPTEFARPRIYSQYTQTSLESMLMTGYRRGYIDNPDYQRRYVWTPEDKHRLIQSIFNQSDIGKFLFLKYDHPEWRLEIVDGKQRIAAIREFQENRFSYEGKYWYQLSLADRNSFDNLMVQTCTLDATQVKKSDVLWLFLSVNHAGVPQTEEHIAKAQRLYEDALEKEANNGNQAG